MNYRQTAFTCACTTVAALSTLAALAASSGCTRTAKGILIMAALCSLALVASALLGPKDDE